MSDLITILSDISKAYPKFELSDEQVRFWSNRLSRFKVLTVSRAVDNHISNSRFNPTLSDLIQNCIAIEGNNRYDHYSVEATQRAQDEAYHAANGRSKVENGKSYCYASTDDIVYSNGKFIKKIDYLMNALGVETVTRELKSITGGKAWSELVSSKGWVPKYKAKLEELMKLTGSV